MKANTLVSVIVIMLAIVSCGPSAKLHKGNPKIGLSYELVNVIENGKRVKVEYACFTGTGVSRIQQLAESMAESEALAKMAEATRGDVRLKGVTRVGKTLISFDKETGNYTVVLKVGVPEKTWSKYRHK